jgi:lysophospholipase L1-like esterase
VLRHRLGFWNWGAPGAALLALLLQGCALRGDGAAASGVWLAAWGSAQLAVEPMAPASAPGAAWREPLRDVSLRQVLRVTAAGSALRLRVSNVMGQAPMVLGSAGVALVETPASRADLPPQARPETFRALRFMGQPGLTLAPGAEAWSDPIETPVQRQAELLVDLHVLQGVAPATAHPGSRIASWAVPGNAVGRALWGDAVSRIGWWHLAALDVRAARAQPVLVAIGDSITDGYGVPPGSYQRWTDVLAQRLAASGRDVAITNTGIGGNRLLRDGLGPSVRVRFERDVLERSGVTHAVLLIGVNDLGVQRRNGQDSPPARAAMLQELQHALRTLAQRARSRGVCLIGATVLPYAGSGYYKPGPDNEADRLTLNDWIRNSGSFDAVLDFDALMRDPARPEHLRADLDSGDGLHPSMAGYRAMADAFPLPLLERRCGVAPSTRRHLETSRG